MNDEEWLELEWQENRHRWSYKYASDDYDIVKALNSAATEICASTTPAGWVLYLLEYLDNKLPLSDDILRQINAAIVARLLDGCW